MPFGRLHEEAASDGKVLALSDAAFRMWAMGLIYCQRNLTDGFIPAHALDTFGIRERNKSRVAGELCRDQVPGKAALWAKTDGGFTVHDYLDWNDSKEEILKGREAGRDRITRFRQRQDEELKRLREIAERSGELTSLPNDARNALRNVENNAHHVVRGSGEESKENQDRPRRGPTGSGAMAGELPRDHRHHVACDPTYSRCVPQAVHDKLATALAPKYAGDRQAAKDALQAWYPTVWQGLAPDFVMPDAFRFWQAKFDADLASKPPSSTKPERVFTVPDADETRRRLRENR